MGWSYWMILVSFAIILALLYLVVRERNKGRFPPAPRGLPILGHLHLLGKKPHQNLHDLAKKHGPIMYMRFGFAPTIIVSSPEAAEQFLKIHDLVCASRPLTESAKYISYGQRNLIFAPYGPYWRNMRKLCTLELLSTHKINSFQPMRREELGSLVEFLKIAAQNHDTVDISAKVSLLSTDITCRMMFGKKYEDEDLDERGFRAMIHEIEQLAGTPNLGDYFPCVGALDIQGLRRRCKAVHKVFDGFLERILDEHKESSKANQIKDFADTMLAVMKSGEAEFEFDRQHVKAILLDMLIAATDTSATVIEWTMSEVLRHPRVMEKVQREVEQVVGMDRMVEESDLESLQYLDMVVKESLRLHPVAPLLVPHESMEDLEVEGFDIPKGSRILVNVWAIGRDVSSWSDPEEFIPERFIGSKIDVRGRDFELIPFGAGRRICPGMQLGLTFVRMVIAQLLHCFDWRLPHDIIPSHLDMTEHFGLVITRANHLEAIPTYRLHK